MSTAHRTIQTPRGDRITCKSWLTEAPLRMLMNNLDPEVAEKPEELVVYGGIGRAQGMAPPKRLMILHRPNGTIRDNWLPNGQRGSILEPFAGVWDHTVALKGMEIKPGNNSAGADPHGTGPNTGHPS